MKNLGIINSDNKEIISAITEELNKNNISFDIINNFDNAKDYKLVVLTGFEVIKNLPENVDIINLHPSLIPAFAENNAIYKSFTSGIKVSGISIHKANKTNFFDKILMQYPVLIGLDTHFEEFQEGIINIAKVIYPKVILATLEDKVFDFSDLFSHSGCSGNCENCKH